MLFFIINENYATTHAHRSSTPGQLLLRERKWQKKLKCRSPQCVCVYGMGGKVKEKKKETLRTVSWPTHTIPSTTWNAIWKFLLLLPATRKPKQQQPTTLYIRLTQAITYASKGIYERREESVVCTSRRDVSRATIIGRVPPPNRILLLFSLCIHIERVVNRSKNHERHSYLVPKKGTKISSFYFASDVLTFLDGVTSRLDTPILLFHIWMRKCFCFDCQRSCCFSPTSLDVVDAKQQDGTFLNVFQRMWFTNEPTHSPETVVWFTYKKNISPGSLYF